MNILSNEEMKQAEVFLSKISTKPQFKLKLPTQKQLLKMTTFQGSLFPVASQSAQKQLRKMLALSQNMRSLKQAHSNPNSVFQMITFTLISLLYQDKHNSSNDVDGSHYILQTIKCSLYANDIDFKHIKNTDFAFETNQLKIMVFYFFSFMEQQSKNIKNNRIKCAQWIFQQNPQLLFTFILFLRFILFKLGIEDAKDYKKAVNSSEAITNLLSFFDLNYRNLGELILFSQDGLFLSIVQKEIVLGCYYENQRQKENHKKHLEIKTSVKLNMIQSLLMNAQEQTPKSMPRKRGIFENDFKMFNFMLQSSSSDGRQRFFTQKQRELELQTPYFQENTIENFQTLKKKKSGQFKREEVRSEFQKIMMEESLNHKGKEGNKSEALIGLKQSAYLNPKNSHKSIKPENLDSPIDQLSKMDDPKIVRLKQPPKNYVSHANFRKTTEQKESYINVFLDTNKKDINGSFYSGKTHCLSTQSIKECSTDVWTQITNCSCRKTRQNRNFITSKVIEIAFAPYKNQKKNCISNLTSPKFVNHERKDLENHNLNKNQPQQANRQDLFPYLSKKPNFLNNLKKAKLQNTSQQNISQPQLNEAKNNSQAITKHKSQTNIKRIQANGFNSSEQFQNDFKLQTKSNPKTRHSKTTKAISDIGDNQSNNKRLDNKEAQRYGVSKPWQTNSNFIQKMPQYSQINKIKNSHASNPNLKQTSIKFFIPAQIVSPKGISNTSNGLNKSTQVQDSESKIIANPEKRNVHLFHRQMNSKKHFKEEISPIQPKQIPLTSEF